MSYSIRFLLLLTFIVGAADTSYAQFRGLVDRLPRESNTLVLFNVEQLHRTPLAVKEKWRENHESQFASGFVIVPPASRRFAMAAKMDFDVDAIQWQAAVMDLSYTPSMPKVAAAHGGSIDEIDGLNAAILPSDAYVVQFGKSIAGIMMPANRQVVGRWIKRIHSNQDARALSPYLLAAESYADTGTPIVMAMDMEHVVSEKRIRNHLDSMASLKGSGLDLDQVASLLGSLKGATLGITVKDKVYGRVLVDFDKDVSMLAKVAKPLFLEVLAHKGAMIDEFNEWTPEVKGKRMTLSGVLYESGRQRILSVVDAPPALQAASTPAAQGQDEQQVKALATQQYFNSLQRMYEDLRGSRRSTQNSVTSGQIGMWFEKYARKIDRLPVLNVDQELIEFGSYISSQLRDAESSMKGVGARSRVRQQQVSNDFVYNYGYAGGYRNNGWRSRGGFAFGAQVNPKATARVNQNQRTQVRTQERIRGNTSANLIMQGLDAEIAEMRKRLTQRYQVEF